MNLAKGLSDRTVATGKISFGLHNNNLLKASIHWDQYFRKISRTPSLIGIINAAELRATIEAERQRARIRKYSLEESTSLSKAADPGKIKRHKDLIKFSKAINNYLSTILGQDVILFIYVIRGCAALEHAIELQPDANFEQLSINCVLLSDLT